MTSALSDLRDNTLIEMAREGEPGSFTELMGRHQGAVKRRIGSIVRNPSDVDDLLQEAFFKAWRGLATFRGDCSFRTWLSRIATNEALMFCRNSWQTRSRQPLVDFDLLVSSNESVTKSVMRAEAAQVVYRAVMQLPPKYREVVILRDIQEISTRETAQRLNSTVSAVKSRLFRGRHLLLAALRPPGDELLATAA